MKCLVCLKQKTLNELRLVQEAGLYLQSGFMGENMYTVIFLLLSIDNHSSSLPCHRL